VSAPLRTQVCIDCKREFVSVGLDALCIPCRLAQTARNMAPATCPRCGKPLAPHKYRWTVCSDCHFLETVENIQRFGAN
jgi:ribosomal protein S27AE